ncbi:MAG TPA: response regulator transcription factor [Dongiaceae bacterium]|nr:response regulator transcription factor [Dongiaceae bacterium]
MRILIADDHTVVRCGLRAILSTQTNWQICAEAVSGDQALEQAKKLRPDVAILDLSMPGIGGLEAAEQIKRVVPGTEIVVLTCYYSRALLREILARGILGFVLKSDAERDLIAAVEAVHRGQPYVSRNPDALLPKSSRISSLDALLMDCEALTKTERTEVRQLAEQLRQIL